MAHHIYLIQSPEFPDYVKIGRTERPVLKRVKEIERAFGASFEVVRAMRVPDQNAEGWLHDLLADQRVLVQIDDDDHYWTEFFRVSSAEDKRAVEYVFDMAAAFGAIDLAPPRFTRAVRGRPRI